MSEEKIKQSIELYDYIVNAVGEEYSKNLDFAKEFHEKYRIEKLKLPYHINIIDELHINENGHSRILTKLLMYQDLNGESVFLQSLISYIKQHARSKEFDALKISKPKITQEFQRIDLWLRDYSTGYAIIFENKVNNAIDQEFQISRYIDKTKDEGFNEDNIFVVYLSNSGKEPEEQSWGNYKKSFSGRYINLTFKYSIIDWIRHYVQPNIQTKDKFLQSAIFQYVDFLEGLFNLRLIQKSLNMSLENYIKKHFAEETQSLCKNNELYEFYKEKKQEAQNMTEALQRIEDEYFLLKQKDLYRDVLDSVIYKYGSVVSVIEEKPYNESYVAVSFSYKDKSYVVQINSDKEGLFCQIEYAATRMEEDERCKFKDSTFAVLCSELLPERPDSLYYRWRYFNDKNDACNIYEAKKCFIDVIDKCVQFIKHETTM